MGLTEGMGGRKVGLNVKWRGGGDVCLLDLWKWSAVVLQLK